MGTGTRDMIRRCTEAGLPEPAFAVSDRFQTIIRRAPAPGQAPQPESQPESLETRVFLLLESGPKSKAELSRGLGQKEISGQLNKVVCQLLAEEMIEYTIPEKTSSRHQKYRLTGQGRAALAKGSGGDTP